MQNRNFCSHLNRNGLFSRVIFSILLISLVLSCSPETNILALSTPRTHKETYDAHLALGRAYYDASEFDKALISAEKAFSLNPESEEAAVLLGYVYLAKSDLSPFTLVEKLEEQDKKEKEQEESESDEDSDSGGTLSELSGVIGLNSNEFTFMGNRNDDVPGLPVIEPACAGEARKDVERLAYVNKAIKVICAFVDDDLLLDEDERHNCVSNQENRQHRAESHLLWALSHLLEALAFHSVITYNTTGLEKSNLELRVDRISQLKVESASDIPALLEEMDTFAKTIDNVLQVSGFCSAEHPQTQLAALVNDLISVSYAFSRMPGIPPSMTESLTEAIEGIRNIRDKTSGIASSEEQADKMKGDLTKKMTEGLKQAVDKLASSEYTPEQAEEVCSSFDQIGGSKVEEESIPEVCQ